jgi:hypothetical protein
MGQGDGKGRTEAAAEKGSREILPERVGGRHRMGSGIYGP